jgi:hypothetical protein
MNSMNICIHYSGVHTERALNSYCQSNTFSIIFYRVMERLNSSNVYWQVIQVGDALLGTYYL